MDEGKVSKARMRLVRSRCQRIRAPKLEHAVWQDGARTPFPGTARACRGASSLSAQERRHKSERSMVCSSWFLTRSSIQIQAWPVHQTRPNRSVGLRMLGPWPRRNSRSNHSSQSRSPTDTAVPLEADRRLDTSSFSAHAADRRLDTSSFFLAFLGLALLDRLRGHVIGPSFEFAAALRQWVADTSR